jgi:hypothetical protein
MTEKNKKTGGSDQRQDSGHKSGHKKSEKPVREADLGPNDPNDPNSPEKKIQIDDDPDETQRKIPHMNN